MKAKLLAIVIGMLFVAVTALPFTQAAPPTGQGNSSNLSPTEAYLVNSLNIGNAMSQLEKISGMGEKIVGTAEEHSAQEYVYNEMTEMSLDSVVMETYPTTSWEHSGDKITIVSPVSENVPGTIYCYNYGIWGKWFGEYYSFGNADNGKKLTAPVVNVGLGTNADFKAIGNLNGAIALVFRDDNIQAWPHTMGEEAALFGASAIISYGYYDNIVNPDGIKQDVVGTSIPYFSISKNSALHIIGLMGKEPVVLSLEGMADAVTEKFGESVNVAGYMYGTVHPEEYIVFSGHIDCFWNGTSDNSASIACVLEFARLFSEAREKNKFINERTLVFLSVGGEEFGGPSDTWFDWLVGSYEFVIAHPEIVEGLVVELNMDCMSFKKTSGQYWVENTWEINGLISQAIKDMGSTGQISYYNPIWSWTDAWSFGAKAGGSTANVWWVTGYDAIYHTQLDDFNLADKEPIQYLLELYLLMAMRSDHALVMPFDFTPTIDWVAGYLSSEQFTVPYEAGWFAKANAALDVLRKATADINAYAGQIKEAFKIAKTDVERTAIRAEADSLNSAMLEARRIINRWTLGEGGTMGSWDVFLRTDQHAHDLMYVDSAIAALQRDKGRVNNAMKALESVYTMEWGHLFSPETYETVMGWMINDEMYWGDDFDQQQAYVNVHWIYMGLKDETLSVSGAITALNEIRNTQLIPWLEEDLGSLEWAYGEAAMILSSATP